MTWSFAKDQNGVRFGKCVPRFAQLWSWKCFSSANNAAIRTENCQLYIIFNWFKWSDLKCYIWIARDSAWVGWRWSRESENERSCFNMVMPTRVEWMYQLVPVSDGVNQCSLPFIMRMPSVCNSLLQKPLIILLLNCNSNSSIALNSDTLF